MVSMVSALDHGSSLCGNWCRKRCRCTGGHGCSNDDVSCRTERYPPTGRPDILGSPYKLPGFRGSLESYPCMGENPVVSFKRIYHGAREAFCLSGVQQDDT